MNFNVDWIMAMLVFVLLVGWSFTYYSSIFDQISQPVSSDADTINDKVMGFLEEDSYDIVVRFNISADQPNSVMHLNLTWPDRTQNSTQVHLGNSVGNNLTCNITDDQLYWKADLVKGDNYFLVHFINRSCELNCSSDSVNLSYQGINHTIAWAMEKKNMISWMNIEKLDPNHGSYIDYDTFRDNQNIQRDFRIELYNETSLFLSYGESRPLGSNVYTRENWGMIDENRSKINLSVMVW